MTSYTSQVSQEDRSLGAAGESRVEPLLRQFAAADVKRTKDPFHAFDYVSKSTRTYFELKTRRVAKDDYPTTVVPASKVELAKSFADRGIKTVFIFAFTDGDFFVRWPFDYEEKSLCRHDRTRSVLHAYIRVDELIPLNRFNEATRSASADGTSTASDAESACTGSSTSDQPGPSPPER